jgi:site-specific recombinase XerD
MVKTTSDNQLVKVSPRKLARVGYSQVPAVIGAAGERASKRFFEFFTANIENPHTREAYARDVSQFLDWCDARGVSLEKLDPMAVAAYVKHLQESKDQNGAECSKPTTKRKLAAIRMMFDYLVTGGVLPFNPASSVRGPKYTSKRGKTPVLDQDQARELIDSIDVSTLVGLRDRALIGVMIYSFARVSAVVGMNVADYYANGKTWWFRLHEKGGKFHEVPAHHKAEEYLDAYIEAAGIIGEKKAPLFRSAVGKTGTLNLTRLHRLNALQMVKRRADKINLPAGVRCHTFRATGITNFLQNGGKLEEAQAIAAHESTRTTKLYDRRDDTPTLDAIERITI